MADDTVADDEISLSDIIRRLWAGRGIIVILPIIAAGLAVLFVVLSALGINRPVTYFVNLKSIENQRYPNGTAFSPQDLLISDVLAEVRTRFDIPANVDVREAITVNYDSPVAAGITRAYRDRLTARNLTQAEISTINDAYTAELGAAVRSSLRINVDYRALGVDAVTGLDIARTLPEIWTKIYTTQFRIFMDTRLADYSVTRTTEDLATTSSILVADARLATMRRGLEIILSDNRLSLLRTPDGTTPADLREDLRRFTTVFFNPIKIAGFQHDDAVSAAYVAELRMDLADMRRRIAAYDESLKELRDHQRASQMPAAGQPAAADGSMLQVGDAALREIVQLAQQASFATFVQDTLNKRNDLMFQISGLIKELELATHNVEAVSQTDIHAPASEALHELTGQYSQLITAARTQILDRGGDLYEPALGPLITGSLINTRNIMLVFAAALAGGLLAVIGVLSWSFRPRKA